MKIRMKFTKTGIMRYIGHLDVMRYFQKVIRRSEIDVAYSEGYSPHQIMSFACPLGVGLTSEGEYVDIVINSSISSNEAINKLNSCMASDDMNIVSFKLLDDNSANSMSIVAAASYKLTLYTDNTNELAVKLNDFLSQSSILTIKKTKKSEIETDIKPFIYDFNINSTSNTGIIIIDLLIGCGSSTNLKPSLIIDAFSEVNTVFNNLRYDTHRVDLFALKDSNPTEDTLLKKDSFISLDDFGTIIS